MLTRRWRGSRSTAPVETCWLFLFPPTARVWRSRCAGQTARLRLHTRLNQSQVTPLAGVENPYSPASSPTGDWIGFFADTKLKKIAVGGRGGHAVRRAPGLRGKLGRRWQHHRGAERKRQRPLAGPFRRQDARAGDEVELRRAEDSSSLRALAKRPPCFLAWTAVRTGEGRPSTLRLGLLYANANEMAWLYSLLSVPPAA